MTFHPEHLLQVALVLTLPQKPQSGQAAFPSLVLSCHQGRDKLRGAVRCFVGWCQAVPQRGGFGGRRLRPVAAWGFHVGFLSVFWPRSVKIQSVFLPHSH